MFLVKAFSLIDIFLWRVFGDFLVSGDAFIFVNKSLKDKPCESWKPILLSSSVNSIDTVFHVSAVEHTY